MGRRPVNPDTIKKIAFYLQEGKLTQQEIAIACHVSQATVSNVHRGFVGLNKINYLGADLDKIDIARAKRDGYYNRAMLTAAQQGWEGSEADKCRKMAALEEQLYWELRRLDEAQNNAKWYSGPIKRTPEMLEKDREWAAAREADYQDNRPEPELHSNKLPAWDKCLEWLGPNHILTKRYLNEPKDNRPILQLAIRVGLDPRGGKPEETASKPMLDNLLMNVEKVERDISGSRSWRQHALDHYNEPLIITEPLGEEKRDEALEEFMSEPRGEGDQGGQDDIGSDGGGVD